LASDILRKAASGIG